MARIRIPDAQLLQSWDDVNQALREIGELEIKLASIEGEMNLKLNIVKETADTISAPHKARIAELGGAVKAYCEKARVDFGKAKTKKLTFGEVGWRRSRAISIKKGLEERIIQSLRALGMADCVVAKESINKNVLLTYPDTKIIEAGATVKNKDTFGYVTNKEELKP